MEIIETINCISEKEISNELIPKNEISEEREKLENEQTIVISCNVCQWKWKNFRADQSLTTIGDVSYATIVAVNDHLQLEIDWSLPIAMEKFLPVSAIERHPRGVSAIWWNWDLRKKRRTKVNLKVVSKTSFTNSYLLYSIISCNINLSSPIACKYLTTFISWVI